MNTSFRVTRSVIESFLLLCLFALQSTFAQQRYLVSPSDEYYVIKNGESAASILSRKAKRAIASTSAACGSKFIFGYIEPPGYVSGIWNSRHKDVVGQWFVAKATGTIDTIFWFAYWVGALDSTVYLSVRRSNIGPSAGPGVRPGPYNPPCQSWGYYVNTNDQDQGIAPFPELATDTTWHSTYDGAVESYPPFGEPLWGFATGMPFKVHPMAVNSVAMMDAGFPLNVNTGDVFFISMRVRGAATHPDPVDNPTAMGYYGYQAEKTDENYPSRAWKFYEHGTNNSGACAAEFYRDGWYARGGFSNDSLFVAVLEIWYSTTATTNVPPNITWTDILHNTFETGSRILSAEIQDCDPALPVRAGVKTALVKWKLNNIAQADITMSNIGGDTWQANFPGELVGSLITYKIYAEDSTGASVSSAPLAYRVVEASNGFAQIDTAGPCLRKSIRLTGTELLRNEFYLPPNAFSSADALDGGTAGPLDIGADMPLWGDAGRYVWVGVNGAIAISKNPLDTVDVNAWGFYAPDFTFPYSGSLRRGGRSDLSGGGRMPGNFIAPLWADLWLGDSNNACGRILYQNGYNGDTCLFIVEWDSIGGWFGLFGGGSCDETTFRVILNRCDGTIEYQYDDLGLSGAESLAIVGVEADSTALTVPNPALSKHPPYIFINESGYPLATRPRAGSCIKIFQATINTAIAGWNMVSVGVIPVRGDYSKAALYPQALTRAYNYDGVYIPRSGTLKNGVGYWMKFSAGENAGARGALLRCVVDTLLTGWNMIGTPGFPLSTIGAVVNPPTLLSQYYEYTGAYHAATILKPGRGYWIKATGPGTLTLCGNVPSIKPKNVPRTNFAELNSLTLRDNSGRYQTLYLGEESIVKEALSFYELPPRAPEFDARFASQRMVETYPSHLSEKTIYEYPILIDASAYPVTISWNIVAPAERKLVLTSPDGKLGSKIMDGTGSVKLTDTKSVIVKLERVDQPTSFALMQNYPNPFNPKTDVRYAISDVSHVILKVFDVLGREVATLVNEVKQPGAYNVEWDAAGFPSGVYFYRLTARSFSDTKKLILLK